MALELLEPFVTEDFIERNNAVAFVRLEKTPDEMTSGKTRPPT